MTNGTDFTSKHSMRGNHYGFVLVLVALGLLSLDFLKDGSQQLLADGGRKSMRNKDTRTSINMPSDMVNVGLDSDSDIDDGDAAVRVLFGASGSDPDFEAEMEIALKSVLLNAPLDLPLEILYMADKEALSGIKDMLRRIQLKKWKLRNRLSVRIYNVESHIERWKQSVDDVWNRIGDKPHFRHLIGAYFRLFAHTVLPNTVKHVIYMDSDVVITANLQELWRHIDQSDKQLFQWGAGGQCSGFVVFNVQRLQELWNRIPTLVLPDHGNFGDQRIMRTFNETYPKLVGSIPREWDINLKNGFQGQRGYGYDKATPEEVQQDLRNGGGMLHFNGGGGKAYFEKHNLLESYVDTFGLARYYINMQWSWCRFMVESKRRSDNTFYLPTIETSK